MADDNNSIEVTEANGLNSAADSQINVSDNGPAINQETSEDVVTDNSNSETNPRGSNILENVDRDQETARRRRQERMRHLMNPRDRLFHALFIKIGIIYSRLFPKRLRLFVELLVLVKGLVLFTLLSYLHFSFSRLPMNCLNTTEGSWPRDGILRLQIQTHYSIDKDLPRFYSPVRNQLMFHPCHDPSIFPQVACPTLKADMKSYYLYHERKYDIKSQCYRMNLSSFLQESGYGHSKHFESYEYVFSTDEGEVFKGYSAGDLVKEDKLLEFYEKYLAKNEPKRHYIFEYSLEFGFLRLSTDVRKRLNIPIKTITLDPRRDKCFGDKMSRFILKWFLGYDDVLLNSIKKIADTQNNTGYMRNVVTGDHYQFVSIWMGRVSYLVALTLMFMFTVAISTLLRFCHQQVFFFIIHLLQMMDWNIAFAFPIAPLFTVILSLVGMETIMSEFFNDTTTSFYIILIVWAVDQFDTICCHTVISQKYWLRFFFLYHFVFYAYHYRFNGQYSSLALAATWLLIQHSMLYFFHHYELPMIEGRVRRGEDDEDVLDEAVQLIVEGFEVVAGQRVPVGRRQVRSPLNPDDGNQLFNANNDVPDVQNTTPASNVAPPAPPTDTSPQTNDEPGNGYHATRTFSFAPPPERVFAFGPERPIMAMIRTFINRHFQSSNNQLQIDLTSVNRRRTDIAGDPAQPNQSPILHVEAQAPDAARDVENVVGTVENSNQSVSNINLIDGSQREEDIHEDIASNETFPSQEETTATNAQFDITFEISTYSDRNISNETPIQDSRETSSNTDGNNSADTSHTNENFTDALHPETGPEAFSNSDCSPPISIEKGPNHDSSKILDESPLIEPER